MTKHDKDARDELTPAAKADRAAAQDYDPARESTQAEAARVASLTPGSDPTSGEAPVEPHTEMFPHQPHGQAGQPANRPAHEGHQGVTPLQPEAQDLSHGVSPTEAVTHGEPSEVIPTEYARHKSHADKGEEKKGKRGEGKR